MPVLSKPTHPSPLSKAHLYKDEGPAEDDFVVVNALMKMSMNGQVESVKAKEEGATILLELSKGGQDDDVKGPRAFVKLTTENLMKGNNGDDIDGEWVNVSVEKDDVKKPDDKKNDDKKVDDKKTVDKLGLSLLINAINTVMQDERPGAKPFIDPEQLLNNGHLGVVNNPSEKTETPVQFHYRRRYLKMQKERESAAATPPPSPPPTPTDSKLRRMNDSGTAYLSASHESKLEEYRADLARQAQHSRLRINAAAMQELGNDNYHRYGPAEIYLAPLTPEEEKKKDEMVANLRTNIPFRQPAFTLAPSFGSPN